MDYIELQKVTKDLKRLQKATNDNEILQKIILD